MRRLALDLRMLTRFVYASHARSTAEADIPGILAWSRRVNPELGVTGVLCFLDGVYMQYIEGEETALEALFSSIRKDARHDDVTLLERRVVPRRAFSDWAMSFLEWDDNTQNIFRSFSPGKNLSLYASDPSTAAPLVRALIRGAGWKLAID
ncbi:MAG: BLUF domain-containing protein [Comamonadaceae bacterium]|nr:MAG: BLUF domain-containing protein [Comamonadaceae bacterium]